MTDDNQLLERFATGGDEDAFRELIERHLDLVYSAALRRVNGDASLAQDVAQTVFTDLARKASSLQRDVLLTGWLYEATRFVAANAIRGERRRQSREQEAMTMQLLTSESTPGWEQLSPVLDDAMGDLCAADRNAILLRYFKNQDFQTVGLALGVSDTAAQKRVSRAVEHLRKFFAKRGVTVGASGLAVVISANAVQAAPVGLGVTISTAAALVGTSLVTTATATITATKAIVMTTLQKTIVAAAFAGAIGTGIYQTSQAERLRKELQTFRQQQEERSQQAQRERDAETARLSALKDEIDRLKSASTELWRLRAEVTRLRAAEQELSRFRAAVPSPANPPAAPAAERNDTELTRDSWADAGFATPQAALRTRGWSVLNGQRDRFKESVFVTEGARKMLEAKIARMLETLPQSDRAKFVQQISENQLGLEEGLLMPMMAENKKKEYTGYRIVSQQSPSAEETVIEVETLMASAPSRKESMKLRRFGSDWKVVIDEDLIKSMR